MSNRAKGLPEEGAPEIVIEGLEDDISFNNLKGYALEIAQQAGEKGVKNFFIVQSKQSLIYAGEEVRPNEYVGLDVIDAVIDYIVAHEKIEGFNQEDADEIRSKRPSMNN